MQSETALTIGPRGSLHHTLPADSAFLTTSFRSGQSRGTIGLLSRSERYTNGACHCVKATNAQRPFCLTMYELAVFNDFLVQRMSEMSGRTAALLVVARSRLLAEAPRFAPLLSSLCSGLPTSWVWLQVYERHSISVCGTVFSNASMRLKPTPRACRNVCHSPRMRAETGGHGFKWAQAIAATGCRWAA